MIESMNTQLHQPFNILLIGDDCIDIYKYGTVDRLSPEAPVPVFEFVYDKSRPGMAGNVLQNLQALGATVRYLHNDTSTKTRLIELRSKQQIVRIDNDVNSLPITVDCDLSIYDAIVISDYVKGTVSYELVEQLRKDYLGPIFVDTKKHDVARFEGCFVKINSLEYSKITSTCSNLIVTQGENGATFDGCNYPAPRVDISDVCGAGDTFLAALAYWYLMDFDIEEAIRYAIQASAITVQHLGVYAPTHEEIQCA